MYLSSASINMTSGILEKGGCNVALIADNSWLANNSWNNFGVERSFLSTGISDVSRCSSLYIYGAWKWALWNLKMTEYRQ